MTQERELQHALEATRSNVKASMRSLRATLQFLTDLEERISALETAQPQGGKANGAVSRTEARTRIPA